MPNTNRYLSSLLLAFSTFGDKRGMSAELLKSSSQIVLDVLQTNHQILSAIHGWDMKLLQDSLFAIGHSQSPEGRFITDFAQSVDPSQINLFIHEYLLALAAEDCSKSTIKNYRSDIKQFWSFSQENELKNLLAKPKLTAFLKAQLAKGLKESSVTRKLKSITQFGLWVEREQLLDNSLGWLRNSSLEDLVSKTAIETPEVDFQPSSPLLEANQVENEDEQNSLLTQATSLPIIEKLFTENTSSTADLENGRTDNVLNKNQNSQAKTSTQTETLTIPTTDHPSAQKHQNYRARMKSQMDSFSSRIKGQIAYHTRDKILPYLNLGLLVLFFLGMGFLGYRQLITDAPTPFAYPSDVVTPNRVLNFQGRLTDTAQNPITTSTNLEFRLYDALTSGTLLWDSSTCAITPDQDGIFSASLGDSCGSAIAATVFSENSDVWLEVQVAAETLTPRQKIHTVAYALNTDTVQGYPISATESATANTILVMDEGGYVRLGEVSPKLVATGGTGTFTIEGQALLLQTASGTNGDITLAPDGTGGTIIQSDLDVQGYATASSSLSVGTYDAPAGPGNAVFSGKVGVGDATPTSLFTVGDTDLFQIDYSGDIVSLGGVAHTLTDIGGALTITSNAALDLISAGDLLFTDDNATDIPLTVADGTINAALGQGIIDAINDVYGVATGGSGSSAFWTQGSGSLYPNNSTVDLLIGGQATSSAKFAVLNVDSGTPVASVSAGTAGAAYLTATGNLATTAQQTLVVGGATTGRIQLQPNSDTGDYLEISSDGTDLTIATTDAANLTINPDSTADIYFHGSTYNLSDTGDLTLGGRITFENAGYIQNEANGILEVNEPTIQLTGSTALDIDSPSIDTTTQATNFDLINSNTAALTFETNLLRLDTSNTAVEVTGTTNLGDGGTTDYASFNATGDLTFNGAANTITGPGANGVTVTNTGGDIQLITVTSGELDLTGAALVDINAGANLDIDVTGTTDILSSSTFSIDGTGASNVSATSGNLTLSTITSGDLTLTTAGNLVFTGFNCTGNNNGGVLTADASGNISCDDDDTGAGGTSYWRLNNGAISPTNDTADVLIGSSASSSAKFAFLNVNSGTPTASVSAGTAGAAYLTATGNLATTAQQTLVVGGATTGRIQFQPNSDTGDYLEISSDATDLSITTTDSSHLTINPAGTLYFQDTNYSIDSSGVTTISDLTLGSNDATATITTADTNEDLTIDPNGTGDIYFHGSTYNLSDTGDLTLGGRITFENAGYIQNEVNGTLEINEPTIQLTGSTALDIDSPSIDTTTQATNFDLINSNAAALTFETNLLRLDTSNTAVEVTGTTNLGDGGTTDYASFNATGDLTLNGAANTITGPGANGITVTNTGGDIQLITVTSGELDLTGAALVDINAGANLDIDVTGTTDILSSGTFSIDGTGASNVSATSGNLTLSTLTSGDLTLTTAGNLVFTGFNCTGNTNGGALTADASGIITCTDDDGGGASTSYWRLASGALSPVNDTTDLLIGSNASASAKFAVLNVNTGTPVASVSANSGNIATYLTGDGTLGTTNQQTLTLGSSSTGDIAIAPDGTNAIYAQTGGNVGIGTAAPSSKLHVYNSDGSTTQVTSQAATNDWMAFFANSTFGPAIHWEGSSQDDLRFGPSTDIDGTGFSEKARITTEGYLGVGTTDPETTIHAVTGGTPGGEYTALTLGNTDFTSGMITNLVWETDSDGGSERDSAAIKVTQIDADSASMHFFVDEAGLQERMTILNSGNVGIGDTSPASLFTVGNGDLFQINSSGEIVAIDNVAHTLTDSSGDLSINSNGGSLLLADTDTLVIGGLTGVAYNAISDAGTATYASSDNDLYIEDILEVDGTLYLGDTAIDKTGLWQNTLNVLHPAYEYASVTDLSIGGTSTSSATIHANATSGLITAADLTLGRSDTTATIATEDTNEDLTIDPNGTGDIYFHGSTYNLSDTGDLTLGGRITFENAGYIQNEVNGTLEINEPTIQLTGSTALDIDSPSIDTTTQATNFDLINSNTAALTFETNLLRLDTSNTSVEVTGTTNLGDGGTTDYASFNATGDLTFNGAANTITGPGANGITITNTGGDIQLTTVTSGEIDLTGAGLVDINAGANLDVDVTGTIDLLASTTFSIDGTGASNVSATSGNLTLSTITSGDLTLTSAGNLVFTGFNCNGANGGALTADASGIVSCTDDDAGGTAYWQLNNGALSPFSLTADVLLGTTASSSAKIRFAGSLTGGKAVAIFNQTENQDIITASASGVTQFTVTSTGDVVGQRFVDTASSTYYLDAAASGTSLSLAGNIINDGAFTINSGGNNNITIDAGTATVVIGDGTGKLNAGTIDPPYWIDGIGYATYAPSMVGLKEEIARNITLEPTDTPGLYKHTIDFDNLDKNTDLDMWLFSRITDIGPNMEDLIVLLSPQGNANVSYTKNPTTGELTIYGNAPVEVAFRLTAPRFDHDNFGTIRADQDGSGFRPGSSLTFGGSNSSLTEAEMLAQLSQDGTQPLTISSLGELNLTATSSGSINDSLDQIEYTVTGQQPGQSTATIISQLGAWASGVIGNLRAGFIDAQDLIATRLTVREQLIAPTAQIDELETDLISPLTGPDVTIQLGTPDASSSAQPALVISNADGQDVARINADGSTALSGLLTAPAASISGNLEADSITARSSRLDQLEARLAELDEVNARTANIVNGNFETASISGTLYATNIDGFQDRVAAALEEPSLLGKLLGEKDAATSSASLADLGQTLGSIYDIPDFIGTGPESISTASATAVRRNIDNLNLDTDDVVLTATALYVNNYFDVNGSAFIANDLGIGQNLIVDGNAHIDQALSVGQGLILADGSINYQPAGIPEAEISLEIQPSGAGTLRLMAGLLTLNQNGQAIITGDLTVAGNLTVEDTLLTDLLAPTDFTNPFQVQVAGISTESGQTQKSRFEIINELGAPVATISAEGRASFAAGLGVGSEDLAGSNDGTVQTGQTSGKAKINTGTAQTTIKAQINANSLVYVTPIGSTDNQVLYVKSQQADNPETPENEAQFVVGFDNQVSQDVQFNWWIVN